MSNGLARIERVMLPPVRVVVHFHERGAGAMAVFECASCGNNLGWHRSGVYLCRECGVEMLPSEARLLLHESGKALKRLKSDVGVKGGRWRWLWDLFSRKRGPQAPSSG